MKKNRRKKNKQTPPENEESYSEGKMMSEKEYSLMKRLSNERMMVSNCNLNFACEL